MEERIQKILSAAGIASRRAAEEIILEGRVRVNGKVVSELGAKADPDRDHIKVDGKLINPKQPKTYLMLNKPAGCVTTLFDPEGRPTVTGLLKGVRVRVYPVGRLDYDTEGLLLLTNDGDFAFRVTHPSHELPKTYHVKVKGVLDDRQIENLEQGVFLKDGKTAPAKVRKLRKEEANSWIEITIHEGRKRQVRRMIDHTGHSVIKLKRVRVGNLSLGDLPLGSFRYLAPDEVRSLHDLAEGGKGSFAVEQAKPSRRPAAAGHMPAFIDGPKPRARAPKVEASHSAGLRGAEGRERKFERKTRRSGQRSDSRGRKQGEKLFSMMPSGGRDLQFRRSGLQMEEGTRRGAGRSLDRKPLPRQAERRPEGRGGRYEELRSRKPFFNRPDRSSLRDAGPGKGPGTGDERILSPTRGRMQYRGAGHDAGVRRAAGRAEWRRSDRTRGPASISGERGPGTARPGREMIGRPRSRAGKRPQPAGTYPRRPKGPGRHRP